MLIVGNHYLLADAQNNIGGAYKKRRLIQTLTSLKETRPYIHDVKPGKLLLKH